MLIGAFSGVLQMPLFAHMRRPIYKKGPAGIRGSQAAPNQAVHFWRFSNPIRDSRSAHAALRVAGRALVRASPNTLAYQGLTWCSPGLRSYKANRINGLASTLRAYHTRLCWLRGSPARVGEGVGPRCREKGTRRGAGPCCRKSAGHGKLKPI